MKRAFAATLRISDVTLRRFVMILEMLRDEDVLVTTHRLARKLSERERALGYTFMLDRKSLLKCLYALEKKHLIRILELHNVHDDEAPNFEDTSNSTGVSFCFSIFHHLRLEVAHFRASR